MKAGDRVVIDGYHPATVTAWDEYQDVFIVEDDHGRVGVFSRDRIGLIDGPKVANSNVVAAIPKSCKWCGRANAYDAPANRGADFKCGECRSCES